MSDSSFSNVSTDPDIMILRRVPEIFEKKTSSPTSSSSSSSISKAVIIDLETMGLNPNTDAIIEIGALKFSFTDEDGIIEILDSYNELDDPRMPIPEKITQITGITNDDVKDKRIDWDKIAELLSDCNIVICHNSGFDRKFLEAQTPLHIQEQIKKCAFACTLRDINWLERGYGSAKLDYLNFKLGFFYDGHRALNDCWATFNLFVSIDGAFAELRRNSARVDMMLFGVNHYEKRELLKNRKYNWSDGTKGLPKGWWKAILCDEFEAEIQYLEETVFGKKGATNNLPRLEITAKIRYSSRSENVVLNKIEEKKSPLLFAKP